MNVRLGQGYFAYRYSEVRELRTMHAGAALGIGAIATAAVWWLAKSRRRWIGLSALAAAFALWGAWTFFGPPDALAQQLYAFPAQWDPKLGIHVT